MYGVFAPAHFTFFLFKINIGKLVAAANSRQVYRVISVGSVKHANTVYYLALAIGGIVIKLKPAGTIYQLRKTTALYVAFKYKWC